LIFLLQEIPGSSAEVLARNGDYTLVFSFANTLRRVGGASVSSGYWQCQRQLDRLTEPPNCIVDLTGMTNI